MLWFYTIILFSCINFHELYTLLYLVSNICTVKTRKPTEEVTNLSCTKCPINPCFDVIKNDTRILMCPLRSKEG